MTKFRSFIFSLKNVGVRWFTETILFSQELYSLVYELHYPPPPPITFLRCIETKETLTNRCRFRFLLVADLFCHQVVSRLGLKC